MAKTLVHYTDGGPFRDNNQDAYCLRQAGTLWGPVAMLAVCDGIGGLKGGEIASAAAVQSLSEWFDGFVADFTPEAFDQIISAGNWRQLLQALHKQVSGYSRAENRRSGTTVSAVLIHNGKYVLAQVGDTRIYLLSDGETALLTQDQTLAMKELLAGRITPQQFAVDKRRNVVLQCLGDGNMEPVFGSGTLPERGGLLLCSDGFYHQLESQPLHALLSGSVSADTLAELGAMARSKGEEDNLTAVLLRWESREDWQPGFCENLRILCPDTDVLDGLGMVRSDFQEQATMPLPREQATMPLPREQATMPLPREQATMPLPQEQATVPTPEKQASEEQPVAVFAGYTETNWTPDMGTVPMGGAANGGPAIGTMPMAGRSRQYEPDPYGGPAMGTGPRQNRQNPNTRSVSWGGNGLIPDEVCGEDIVDVQPLNATGGFSNLFRAHKRGLDVDVVIKRVKKVYKGKLNDQSEAKIMTALRHQYLPRIYDLKTASDGFTYTIMELIEGCTLRDYVRQRGSLDQKQVLKWTRQLCEVVDYMHTRKPKGIIHSDLKPENVMITPQGDICVIDFNASLEASEEGVQQAIGATAGFAAPEQYNLPPERIGPDHPLRKQVLAAQGMGGVSFRTDIYAIGALAYYMITGYAPKVWTEIVIPLERYDIQLGDAFRQVIRRAMEPRSADRYQSAAQMYKALNNLSKIDSRYRRWVLQSRIAGLVIGLGLMASVLCLILGYGQLQRADDEAYLQLVTQASQLRASGQFEQCRQLLSEAVAMDDDRIEAYLEMAVLLYQLQEYRQAADLLEGVEYTRGNTEEQAFLDGQGQLAYILGSCYFQMEQYPKALQNYQLAVQYSPQEQIYLRELAIAYAKTGNPDLAKQTLIQLQKAGMPAAQLALVNGEISYAYGDYEQAYQQLCAAAKAADTALEKNRCYTMAAQCCQQLGSGWLDTQITMLTEVASELGAENSLVLQMLAEAWMQKGTQPGADDMACYSQAIVYWEQLLNRETQPFQVRLNAALTLQYLDRLDEAIQQLSQLQTDYPKDYRPSMYLAFVYVDQQGLLEVTQRNYHNFGLCLAQARSLYATTGVQDSQMLRLEQLAQQLAEAGWTW